MTVDSETGQIRHVRSILNQFIETSIFLFEKLNEYTVV